MANQVIEVSDICVVETVNGTKQLLSWHDMQIKKGEMYSLGNAGIKFNADLYILKLNQV